MDGRSGSFFRVGRHQSIGGVNVDDSSQKNTGFHCSYINAAAPNGDSSRRRVGDRPSSIRS